jgi:protein-disulfide isomerase
MRPLHLVLLLRVSLLVAVAASAALIVDYQAAGEPAFCGVGSGCYAVRISPYSSLLGIPLPHIGLMAHLALLAGALFASTKDGLRYLALAASVGAACAFVLLFLQQFVIGAFCSWCTAVDIASLLAAVSAVRLASALSKEPADTSPSASPVLRAFIPRGVEGALWGMAAALAVGLPFVWGRYPVIPPLPKAIAALQVPGKVTVIGFTDFQCPFCRKLHPDLSALEHKYEGRIHYERHMMPLPGHPGALPAAEAYVCVPKEKREAAAAWLYNAPDSALTPAGVLAIAKDLDLDRNALAACAASSDTRAALERDKELYQSIGIRGLPLTYIGPRVVLGYRPEQIERSIESEIKGDSLSLRIEWLFALLGAVFAGAAIFTWRKKKDSAPAPAQA